MASPPLLGGDRLLVERRAYRRDPPRRGDLVLVAQADGMALPARVVALPGETLAVAGDALRLDGKPLPRWRVADVGDHARRYRVAMPGGRLLDLPTLAPIGRTVPARSVLVLPPRQVVLATVPLSDVTGRAALVLFSAGAQASWRHPRTWWPGMRWNRIGLRL